MSLNSCVLIVYVYSWQDFRDKFRDYHLVQLQHNLFYCHKQGNKEKPPLLYPSPTREKRQINFAHRKTSCNNWIQPSPYLELRVTLQVQGGSFHSVYSELATQTAVLVHNKRSIAKDLRLLLKG